jgi:capsular exopolysaccharide synthesis family protein
VGATARELAVAAPAPAMAVDARSLLRGLLRNWWRIFLIWLVISTPLVFLLYNYVQPTYRAFSMLQIESNQPQLFGPTIQNRDYGGFVGPEGPPYLATETQRIKVHKILDAAIFKLGGVNKIAMLRGVEDPEEELRKKLEIQILQSTHIIEVALESREPQEAADLVNTIVEVYKERTRDLGKNENKDLTDDLTEYSKKLKKQIDDTEQELIKLAKRGNVEFPKTRIGVKDPDSDQVYQPSFETLPLDQYKTARDRLFQTDLQLMELEAQYQARRSEASTAADEQAQLAAEVSPLQKQQIEEEFKRDPAVADLIGEIRATKDELDHTKSVVRKGTDPARLAAQDRYRKLNEDYNRLWEIKSEQIRRRLLVPTNASEVQSLAQLKRKIDELKLTKIEQQKMINTLKPQDETTHEDRVKAAFLNADLGLSRSRYEQVDQKLEQLKFTQDKASITIKETTPAEVPKAPFNNKRLKYMLALPVAVLFAILGLFVLLEVKSERVANPDMLSSRVRSEVYALPPLPSQRNVRRLEGPVVDDQIDRFIQRLDHLRFAICGDHHDSDLGRCLLVTSAVGGEGKTTLAAQLAARCGNAGISTILVDADLRRAALSPLLDTPEGPGLSDLLNDEIKLEEALVPVQGGAFTLLPAGSSVPDTTSVLQGRNLALLIAQLRQRFELIIIDSPPILPVPDALILGRWTDGALLAARFEVSRSPQVERARNQLDSAGIPLLGTVINGMHSSDAYYGQYTYGRYRTTRGDDSRGPRDVPGQAETV